MYATQYTSLYNQNPVIASEAWRSAFRNLLAGDLRSGHVLGLETGTINLVIASFIWACGCPGEVAPGAQGWAVGLGFSPAAESIQI